MGEWMGESSVSSLLPVRAYCMSKGNARVMCTVSLVSRFGLICGNLHGSASFGFSCVISFR